MARNMIRVALSHHPISVAPESSRGCLEEKTDVKQNHEGRTAVAHQTPGNRWKRDEHWRRFRGYFDPKLKTFGKGIPTMLLLCAWILLLCGTASGGPQGKHFMTAFMENGVQGSSGEGKFKVFITGLQDGTSVTVALYRSTFQKDFVINSGETVPVQLPAHVEMVGTKTFHSTVIIKASSEITVLSLSSKPNSADTTVVYPRYLLGNTYYVTTPLGKASKGFQEFSVIASQDPTPVFIYLTNQVTFQGVTYSAGSKLTISLEAYQAVQIQSHQDLSGTKVVSHKPIAVLSGHSCVWSHNNCQHVFEQLLPTRRWGKVFLVPSLSFQTNYDVVCVTAHQKSHLQIHAGSTQSQRQLSPGQVITLEVWVQKPLYISSDVGIQVLFYSMGGVKNGVSFDPFLSSVLAVSQYSKAYYILGQEGFKNLALLVAESSTCRSITFDKQTLHSAPWKAITGTSYSWTEFGFSVELKTHFVMHPKSPFSLLSIGVAHLNSYGSVALGIAQALPPMGPHPNPCSGMPCGKGYVCILKHNQPQCIPETCKTIKCQEGSLCETVQGLARCVHRPSCHHVQCPEGTICDLEGGFPKCVPLPLSCAAVQCKEGTKCVITNGWPKCIPVPASCQNTRCSRGTTCNLMNGWPKCVPIQASCDKLQCKDGTVCKTIHGQPQCVPAPASCSDILCAKGTICEMVDGQPKCIPVPPSCLHIECQRGTVCDMVGGWPRCIPGPSCKDLNCEAGAECKIEDGLPRCLPIPLSCSDTTDCKPGTVCKIVNGKPTCVAIPSSCNQLLCHEGTICEKIDGFPTCVPTVTSCDKIQCPAGTTCEVVNRWPTCVPIPHACEKVECQKGTICEIVNGWPTCIPDAPTSCASVVCKEEAVCEMLSGKPTCIPLSLSCERYSCRQGTMCEVINGWPTCVALSSSCLQTKCNEGTVCAIVQGLPKCVPIPSTCEKLQCKEGNICTIVNGWPKCVPVPPSCENIYCQLGTVCKMVQGWPACVAIPLSCDKIHCGERALCEMVNGWPQCVPTATSCNQIHCKGGMVCEMIDNWPTCVHVPASCNEISCKNGTVCEMINDWPTCVPIPSSCDQVSCKPGTACQLMDGWPRCVSLLLSCNHVHCNEGTVCEIRDGVSKCVPIPSCDNAICKAGTMCEMVDGWARCVPVHSTCEQIQCGVGTVCQIIDNSPSCVLFEPSCDQISCSIGSVCAIIDRQTRCVPIPSCDKIHCKEGTICEISDGWPKCVPLPTSCERVSCTGGTMCEIISGWPKCVPKPASCEYLHCTEGAVCKVIHGLPACIPMPSSCEKTECPEGKMCKMVHGWPTCIPVSPPACASVYCEEGTACEIYNGKPMCLAMSPSCESVHCSQGTICKIIEGQPMCMSAHPCHMVHCEDGSICKMRNERPTCVPVPASCESIECQKGTVCQIVSGKPHCVPVPPSSCASVLCQVGTVCQTVNGRPTCVPAPPSCDKIHCSPGTVCNIVNGLPKCISVSGSCEHSHCPHGTVCQVVNSRPKCIPAAQSCHTLQCSQGMVCKVVNSSPLCVPVLPTQSVCWASGQPHYHTFDGHSYDFQGTCTYTVVKTCKPHSRVPFFHIFTKSQKSGKSPFSFVSQVTVTVYNSTITMVKYEYGLVRVNQLLARLPIILHDGKLSLYHRGGQLVIETQFGLKVYYDWNHYLVVKLTSAFQSQVCGLCGNYNGDPNDDIVASSGGLATDPVEFGKSWKVESGDGACSHGCHGKCWHCSPELIAKYSRVEFCGLIGKHRGGPFHPCHSLVDPKPYVDDCVTDLCTFEGYKQILCRALKGYADACQREGATISDWRKHSGCPQSCPENSQYMACGSACPATCNDLNAPEKCHLPCMETCQCKSGYVLDGGKCIPQDRCGCIYHGQLYAPNEQFWGDQQCHQHCLCRPHDKQVVCHTSHCRQMEGCHVVNGIRNCYPTSYGTCSVLGQLHYATFDGLHYDFYGNCIYRLAELCHRATNLTHFQVLVQDEKSGPRESSATKTIEVTVYGMTVIISHSKILLNGLLINLPYHLDYYKFLLYRQGWDIIVKTDFGFTLAFDGKNNIRLTVPGTYSGHLCGLCGNFNGQAGDDMTQSNNVVTTSPADFARSWKIRDIPGCTEADKENCINIVNVERAQKTSKECGILLDKSGPFRLCHGAVAPQWYFKDCVYDYCFNKGNKNAICHIISSYAAACQAAGVTVYGWRSNHFCSPSCPANSHYEVCASDCPVTCRNLYNPVLCATKCREGCECNEGYVWSGDQCVPISQCGCVHQGFYYKAGESFYVNGFCKEWCVCQVGGIIQCQHSSCGPNEDCRVVDGVQRCHRLAPRRSGSCHVAGDPHYLTFDGFTFDLQSNCTYTLVKSCTRKNSLPSFVINVENMRRARGKVSVTKAVSVTVYQHTVTILREKRGIILVNGATLFLPFGLESNGMWVYYHGDNVVLQTDFGLFVSFDQLYHLIVMVPESYQGQTCGLCGNYNGNSRDDLLLPTHHAAASIAAFAAAWKVDLPVEACTEDCGALVCGTCQESRKASYVHSSQCGILRAPYGPFSACYSTINPTIFFNNCVHDLCKARGNPVVLCRVVHGYVAACQAAGVKIHSWRTQKFCPVKCPANSHYELCASACPSNCKEATNITRCPRNCAEGCQCNKGYFMAGYHCVPVSQCRCFHKGMWYKVGVKVITSNCMEECICHRQGRVECKPLQCAAGEACVLSNAQWSCVRQEGHCSISQSHIFTSYDGVSGKIPSDGSYEITSLIDTKAQYWFRVLVKLQKCLTCPTPTVVSVTVYFRNLIVLVNRNGVVSVNGHPVRLPVQPSQNISVSLNQDVVTVKHGSYLQVLFGNEELTVVISGKLANQVSRSCGNFNGNGADDLQLPNGEVAHSITEVISHWRVTEAVQQAMSKIDAYGTQN